MKTILILLFTASALLFGATDLEKAYQKEFAFLKAQKRELEKRVSQMETKNRKNIEKAERTIDALQGRMLKRISEAELLSEKLIEAERNELNIEDNSAMVEGVIMQSRSALEPFGLTAATDPKDYTALFTNTFEFASKKLYDLSTMSESEGKFFLPDGTQAEGKIISVGNIASYGISGQNAGALAPAGEGMLKMWAQDAKATAMALEKGTTPQTLQIFIYETLSRSIDEIKEKSVYEVIQSGGIIAWSIVGLGALVLLMVLIRFFLLMGASSDTQSITQNVVTELNKHNLDGAKKACESKKGATARVLSATINHIDSEPKFLDDIVMESIMHESSHLDRFGSFILVIAAVAPLMGLLGTVTGMISTFDVITEFGTGDPKLLSGGISEALVTTELGLIVAIPALLIGNLLSGWAERIKDNMEKSALHVTNVYLKSK